jgi:LCP family protein required for cell wall assembly
VKRLFIGASVLGFTLYVLGGFLVGSGSLMRVVQSWQAAQTPRLQTSPFNVGTLIADPGRAISQAPLLLVPDWQGTDRINVLLLGTDQREEDRLAGFPARTDVVLVVSIDPVAKTAGMVSFPRDLWVTIPGLGEQRINEAFQYGERRRWPGGGAGLVANTLELNFGISIPFYALVNFEGFEQVIDLVGGVLIDVPSPIKDDAYPTPDYGIERIFFLPGPQLMNGDSALKYARTRHSDSDFARNSRQQQVLLAIRERALSVNALANLPALVDKGTNAVTTNLGASEILSLGKLATQIPSGNIRTLGVAPPLVTPFTGIGGASLQMPNRTAIRRAIDGLTEPPASAASDGSAPTPIPAG